MNTYACNTMALNIRNTETERLAAELAQLTGRTKTDAVAEAHTGPIGAASKGTIRTVLG